MAGDVFDSRGHEPRAFTRSGVSITASVREQGGGRQQVEVVDLSQAGFRMRTGSFIAPDRTLFLTLPGYNQLQARIAWHENEYYGCEFVQRLHAAVYDDIVRRYPLFKVPD
jgi:hypothetical protein